MIVAYLSHSLGTSNGDDAVRRLDNVSNALGWFRFLTLRTPWVVVMPWYPSVVTLSEAERPIGYAKQLVFLRTCTAWVAVGGEVSPHMRHERDNHAGPARLALLDLSDLGRSPPAREDEDEVARDLRHRMGIAMLKSGRQPW